MTVWMTGAKGMLGTDVCEELRAAGHEVIATDLEVDITDTAAVVRHMSFHDGIVWVVNCAAYTAVDAAEDDEAAAHRINAVGPRTLATACVDAGARLLHVSTDYVFDGRANVPYQPSDRPNPTGAYGRTKLAGEQAIQEISDSAVILRTAWLYGPAGKNFVSTMIRLMNERAALSVVDDQRGSPTHTRDLASAIRSIVEEKAGAGGVYHYTGAGQTTWYRFAREIQDRAGRRGLVTGECDVQPTTTAAYGAKAPRPAYSVLDCTKAERSFGIRLRDWREALNDYLEGTIS